MTYRRTGIDEKKYSSSASLFGDDELYTPARATPSRHPPSLLDLDHERSQQRAPSQHTPISTHKPHTPTSRRGGSGMDGAPPARSLRDFTPFDAHTQTPGGQGPARYDQFSFTSSPAQASTPPQPSAPILPLQSYQDQIQKTSRITEVTVFGFPPHKAAVVMTRMLRYGEIVRRTDGPGNWFHLQYRDSLGAEMALTQNGKIIDGDTMIGVKPRQLDEIHLTAALRAGVTSEEAEHEIIYGKSIFDRPRSSSSIPSSSTSSSSLLSDSTLPTESFPSRNKPWLNQLIDALFNW